MRAPFAGNRISRRVLLLPLLAVLATCDDGPGPAAPDGLASLAVSAEFGQQAAGLAEAFDQADNLMVRIEIEGREPIVRTFRFTPGQPEIRARIDIPLEDEGVVIATVTLILKVGDTVLFTGTHQVQLGGSATARIQVTLQPRPDRIEIPSSFLVDELGVPIQLPGSAVFATGEPIPPSVVPLTWSTTATPAQFTVTPDGLATAFQNGVYQVQAVAGELTATGSVEVTAVPAITSITPSTVLLGRTTQLSIQGRNFQGATGVTVCGLAAVDDPQLTVSEAGDLVQVPVLWPVFFDGEPQLGPHCVNVHTPRGTATADVILAEPMAVDVILDPTSATLLPNQTLQLEADVFDDQETLLSDNQLSFSSNNMSVATVDDDGLVTAVAEGDATVTATAGSGSATAEITVTSGTGDITGTATVDGNGAGGLTVSVEPAGAPAHRGSGAPATVPVATAVTGPSGLFSISAIPAGDYMVGIAPPAGVSFADNPRLVTVPSGGSVTVDFVGTTESGAVQGTVTVDGSPAEGLTVSVAEPVSGPASDGADGSLDQTVVVGTDVTDVNGQYSVPGLPPGSYVADLSGFNPLVSFPALPTTFMVSPGGTTVLDFTGSSFEPKLVFEAFPGTFSEVMVTDLSGSGPGQITPDPQHDFLPDPSPDGTRIVHETATDETSSDIVVRNVDGSNPTVLPLPGIPFGADPVWSPSGGKIAFWTDPGGGPSVHTVNPDGTALSGSLATGVLPIWSPDGSRIAFQRAGDVFVMDMDGSNQTQLTTHPALDDEPTWSPDGTMLAFRSERDGSSQIYKVPADGSGTPTRLTPLDGLGNFEPAWSPSGTRIAFVRPTGGPSSAPELHLMNTDGTGIAAITGLGSPLLFFPRWYPGGGMLAFVAEIGGDEEIFVVNDDGTGLVQLTDNDWPDIFPKWIPPPPVPMHPDADAVQSPSYQVPSTGSR